VTYSGISYKGGSGATDVAVGAGDENEIWNQSYSVTTLDVYVVLLSLFSSSSYMYFDIYLYMFIYLL
jgi:hypothetical protein